MDITVKELWDHYWSMADVDMEGNHFIDKEKIPTQVRNGITGHPLVEDLEIGHFLPPLHCYLRFLAFFIEMAIRFKAGNQMHGKLSAEMQKKMDDAKKWFREDALKNLERRYLMPSKDGGTTDNGNAAR